MPIVVYKLGGSLLDLPDWPARLRSLRQSRSNDETGLLVVGGGDVANLVRQWDRLYQLGESKSHHLALTSLSLTEHLARVLLPECRTVATVVQARELDRGAFGIVTVREFLKDDQCPCRPVPECWEFSTDSIAAVIAEMVGANELMLLKSSLPNSSRNLLQLSAEGFVDRLFAEWSRNVPKITAVDLRAASGDGPTGAFPQLEIG